MTSAAVYLRISRDSDGREEAPDRQRVAIHNFLKSQGWTTTPALEYLDVSKSASVYARKNRTEYERMVADIGTGKFDVVVVWDIDRLTRQPAQIEEWIKWTMAGRVQLASVNEKVDTGTEGGRLYLRIKGDFAAHESETKSTRIKFKNEQTAVEKSMPHTGRIPFGWRKDRITPNPDEQAWVEFAVKSVAAGDSLYSIARELNAQGVKRGKLNAKTGEREGGATWTATRIREIVLRPSNVGILVRTVEWTTTPKGTKVPLRREQMPESQIQPLIQDREVWEKAKAVLEANPNTAPGRKPSNNWLSNLMLCGVCGATMASSSIKAGNKRTWHYQCSTKAHRNKVSDGRRHVSIKADQAHARMIEFLHAWYSAGALDAPRPSPSSDLVFKIREVQVAIDGATDGLMQGVGNKSRIVSKIKELETKLGQLQRQRSSEIAASTEGTALTEFLAQIRHNAATTTKGIEVTVASTPGLDVFTGIWNDLDIERKRAIIGGTFVTVIKPGRDDSRIEIADTRGREPVLV